ncbi:MAG: tRNA lysidine(34) synthetase TilS [Planctomycetota bacterium]
MKFMDLTIRIWNIIKEHDLFKHGQTIIIGLSGGPDSVSLVNILYQINQRYKTDWRLIPAHLNHRIRGRKSDADERFVVKMTRRLDLPVYVIRRDIPALSNKQKKSLEETARDERYRFFEQIAKRIKSQNRKKVISIAVGHNLDDNAETVIFRIIRGTGLKGLRGILLKRKLPARPDGRSGGFDNSPFYLIRPLLYTARKEILNYLKTQHIPYRIDASNNDKKILRNRIRHQLLPLLKKYNPSVSEHLVQLSETASTCYDYLDAMVKTKLPKKSSTLNITMLKHEHPVMRIEMINKVLEKIGCSTQKITYEHYRVLLKLIDSERKYQELHLPDKVIAKHQGDKLILKKYS